MCACVHVCACVCVCICVSVCLFAFAVYVCAEGRKYMSEKRNNKSSYELN